MCFSRLGPNVLQIGIIALALILNFFRIDRSALWNDEAFSFFAARGGLTHTIRFIADDTQPPLYYLTLNLWLGLGTTVFVIRSMSAVAMTLVLLPLRAVTRRMFDERVALLACLLFAIAPLDVSWAQKARPYPLQVLLVACAFWGFARIWRVGRDQMIGAGLRQAWQERRVGPATADLAWIAYATCGALAMLTQAPAGFFLLGCNVAMAVSVFGDIRRNRTMLLNWIVAQCALLLIWMLWLPAFLRQIAAHLTPEQIASKHAIFLVSATQVLGALQNLFGIAGLWRPGPIFLLIYAVLACVAVVRIIRYQPAAWMLPTVILVPIVACLAGFFLVHPIFGYVINTFIWMAVPFTILIATGVSSLRPRLLRWGVLTIVLTGNAWGIKNVYQSDTPPLDRIASVIRANMAPGDGIVLSEGASGRWGIAYYIGPPYSTPAGLDISSWGSDGLIHSPAQIQGLRRLWVVVPDGEAPAVGLETLRQGRNLTFSEEAGSFRITRFE